MSSENNPPPTSTWLVKLNLYINIVWMLVVIFGATGMLLGNPAGVTIIAVTTSAWVALRILLDGATSALLLYALKYPPPNPPTNQHE